MAASVRSQPRETVELSCFAGPGTVAVSGWQTPVEIAQLGTVGALVSLPFTGDAGREDSPAFRQGRGPLPEIRVEEWGRRCSSPITSDTTDAPPPLGRRARTDSLAADSSSLAGSCDSLSSCGSAARRGLMTPDDGPEAAETLAAMADSLRRFYRLKPPGLRCYRITVSEMLAAKVSCGVPLKVVSSSSTSTASLANSHLLLLTCTIDRTN